VTDSEFSLSGIAFPVTIAAGQSRPFTLTFVPRASGTAAATLSFASNAASAAAENLTGTGVAPPQHSVDLSWDPASAVAGYNVYRASQTGGPYSKINPVLNAGTTFTDNSVQGGQNYYYVTTSVDSTGTQSAYSNEIRAAIPTP
jgi:fibronectin type 3 domain-containing protein